MPCTPYVSYFSLRLTVYPNPLQSTCALLSLFIKLILQTFFFRDLSLVTENGSLYGVFAHIPTNLFAFDILTVLSVTLASLSSHCCICSFSTDTSIHLAQIFPKCVPYDQIPTLCVHKEIVHRCRSGPLPDTVQTLDPKAAHSLRYPIVAFFNKSRKLFAGQR